MQGGDMFWCYIARLKVSPHLTINLEDNINSGIIDQVTGYDAPINTYLICLEIITFECAPPLDWTVNDGECIVSVSFPAFGLIARMTSLRLRWRWGPPGHYQPTVPGVGQQAERQGTSMLGDVPFFDMLKNQLWASVGFEILFKWNLVLSRVVACRFMLYKLHIYICLWCIVYIL